MKREFIPMSGLYDMNIGALRMYYAQRPTPKPENEVKNVVFRCDVVKDKDILEALKDVKNKSDYIKSLLRRALQEENAEKERTEKEELSCAAESAAQGGGNGVIFGWPFLYGKIKAALVFNAAFVFRNAPARKNPLRKNPKARPTFP